MGNASSLGVAVEIRPFYYLATNTRVAWTVYGG